MTIDTFEIRTTLDVANAARSCTPIMFNPGTTLEWRRENERVAKLVQAAERQRLVTRNGLSTVAAELAGHTVGVYLVRKPARWLWSRN